MRAGWPAFGADDWPNKFRPKAKFAPIAIPTWDVLSRNFRRETRRIFQLPAQRPAKICFCFKPQKPGPRLIVCDPSVRSEAGGDCTPQVNGRSKRANLRVHA